MPAHRSRTERWKELLEQIAQRGGGIELAIDRRDQTRAGDLMWRVRLLALSAADMTVEQPSAAGRPILLTPGTPLLGVMTVGQNRWMFHASILPANASTRPGALRLTLPDSMERCIRREFLRVSTAELRLPDVECWPLLEPASVIPAEAANRQRIRDLQASHLRAAHPADDLLPEVGPLFHARLVNIGGGGLGLIVTRDDATAASRARLLWTRLNLAPEIPAPIAITAKVVHTHVDSAQNLYLGAAFDFDFNPAHRDFVVEQITRYVAQAQLRQAA